MITHPIVTRVWVPDIILKLADGRPRNFNRLLEIPGISDRVLTERLRELETAHYIKRLVDVGPPVRVSYVLTPQGVRLVAPLEELWAALASMTTEEVEAVS